MRYLWIFLDAFVPCFGKGLGLGLGLLAVLEFGAWVLR